MSRFSSNKGGSGGASNLSGLKDIIFNPLPVEGDVLTYDSSISKWKAKPPSNSNGGVYFLDLSRWSVKNNGTNAVATTKGINDALTWASGQGYIEVILPRGTYLIDKDSAIEPKSFMTFNLNGSTLRKETNGYETYSVISFKRNQIFSRVTNGIIKGDKDTHDYTTVTGTHEGGFGISLGSFTPIADGGNNIRHICIDNLDISECTGDAIVTASLFGQIFPTPTNLANSWEQGAISTVDGTSVVSTSKIRSTLKIDMAQPEIVKYGYFGLYGDGYGGLGAEILCDYYDVFFYTSGDVFISSESNIQFFEDIDVPANAKWAKVMLHQSNVPTPSKCTINVRTASFGQYIYIEKCDLHHCRRQGISVGGTKNLYIRDNNIHHIKGTLPESGIDVEDGYDINQYIHIENNNFHHNDKYNIIVVNGKNVYIQGNTLSKTMNIGYVGLAVNGGADNVIVTHNTIKLNKVVLSGETIFANNYVYGTQVNLSPVYATRKIKVLNNIFYNIKMVMDSPFAYAVEVESCKFLNDADKLNSLSNTLRFTLDIKQEPQTFIDCIFEGQDVDYLSYVASNATFKQGWVFQNCRFKNTKNPNFIAGKYLNCEFTDLTSPINLSRNNDGTNSLELRGCKFNSTDNNNAMFTLGTIRSFVMKDCVIEKTSGYVFTIQAISNEVIINDNIIKITNDVLPRAVMTFESSFTGNYISVDNNFILATNSTQVAVDNKTTNNPVFVIRNNNLKKTTVTRNGKEVVIGNIIDGVIDPYFKSASAPTSLYWKAGQIIQNTSLTSGGYIGWVCTTDGTANNQAWVATTPYTVNTVVNVNGKVYKCTVAGTSSSIAPSHTTGTASDGTVTWQYVDVLAVFKAYGLIQ